MGKLEVRTECLSGCADGEAIGITGTAWNSVTTIHAITQTDVIDVVVLDLWNRTASAIEIAVILNPDDDTTQASVDASTVYVSVPAKSSLRVLDKYRARKHSSGTSWTLAAYYVGGGSGDVVFTGHYDRLTQADLTA